MVYHLPLPPRPDNVDNNTNNNAVDGNSQEEIDRKPIGPDGIPPPLPPRPDNVNNNAIMLQMEIVRKR